MFHAEPEVSVLSSKSGINNFCDDDRPTGYRTSLQQSSVLPTWRQTRQCKDEYAQCWPA